MDRVRGGRQKYRRVTPYSNGSLANGSVSAAASSLAATSATSVESSAHSEPVKKISLEGMHRRRLAGRSMIDTKMWRRAMFKSFRCSLLIEPLLCMRVDNKILSTLGQCEPEMLTTADIMWPEGESSLANLDPALRILCTLSELYDRELVAAIGWAKQIPGAYCNFPVVSD